MDKLDRSEDLMLAKHVCRELLAGNKESILKIYNKYHTFFLKYTFNRLKSLELCNIENMATTILDDFWVELLNAKAICAFKAIASLKNYLFIILKLRIIDNKRKAFRKNADSNKLSDQNHNFDEFKANDGHSPEKDLMDKEKIRLINETLLMLTDESPSDAYWVKLHLEGLTYNQMAEKIIGNNPNSSKELKKKTDAVKKQFTRKKTGSLAKFKSCLKQVMQKNNLDLKELFV
jgi:DNA-directed RNA polymerase specialized sigma24 family protein